MGESRKRRLALIRGGKAAEAKTHVVAPERLTNLTIQMPTIKADVVAEIYRTKVDKQTCPTTNDFFVAVFDSGMLEFERFYLQENAVPEPKPDIEADAKPDEGGQE